MKLRLFAAAAILAINTHQTCTMGWLYQWIPFIGSQSSKAETDCLNHLYTLKARAAYSKFLDENVVNIDELAETKRLNGIHFPPNLFLQSSKIKEANESAFNDYYLHARKIIPNKEQRIKHFQTNEDAYDKLIESVQTTKKLPALDETNIVRSTMSIRKNRARFAYAMEEAIEENKIQEQEIETYLKTGFSSQLIKSQKPNLQILSIKSYGSLNGRGEKQKEEFIHYYLQLRKAIPDQKTRKEHFKASLDEHQALKATRKWQKK